MNASAIPYFDLKRQYTKWAPELERLLTETARSGAYILSQQVLEFEKNFASYCQSTYGVGVASGTDALVFALRALGIGKGDEVILPSFTFIATAFSVIHAGATPVFAEVDPQTYTLDPKSVEDVLTSKSKAILPVHLYGQAAEMDSLRAIARKRKLKIIEDACQAHGALWKGRKTGSFGDAGCFSFYPTKNLGAMGDGGMLVTANRKLAEQVKRLRNLGRVDMKSPHEEVGWTSRLDGLQACILDAKLKYLDSLNESRRRLAAIYLKHLASTPLALPLEGRNRRHVYHLFVVRVPGGKRDALQNHLASAGISSLIHYAVPCHRQPSLQPYLKKKPKFPLTEQLAGEILSLPMFPEMTHQEVEHTCDVIQGFYKS